MLKGVNKLTGEKVAIKHMKIGTYKIKKLRAVLGEIQAMKQLAAMPNNIYTTQLQDLIVPDVEPGQPIESIFLVMGLCNRDLKRRYTGFMNEREIVKTLYNILCAMNFLHSTGLMHRDIKANNFLVNDDGSVRICDFGFVRPVK